MKKLAAKLWRAGIRNASGMTMAVITVKAAIKTRNWKPNSKAFWEGVAEGVEDGLRYHMRRFREIERDQGKDVLKREIDKALKPAAHHDAHDDHGHAAHGADSHGGHGAAHGHAGGHQAAAATPVHPYNDVDELMAKHPQRALITTRLRAIRDLQPDIWQFIIRFDGRGAFFTPLADIVLGNPDPEMAVDSIERLIVKHGKAVDDERKAKSAHPEDRWFKAVGSGFNTLNRVVDRGLDHMGVPPARHLDHDHSPAPATPGDGENWEQLMHSLRNRQH
jgi:hypothetical protein